MNIENPTEEQDAIFRYTRIDKGDLLIDAVAGSGKTSTIIAALPNLPQRSILLSAFNKRIAGELEARVPKMPKGHVVHVKTFHALGLSILKSAFKGLEVEAKATEDLVNQVAEKATFTVRRKAVRLLRAYKEIQFASIASVDGIRELGTRHGWLENMTEKSIDETCELASLAYDVGKDFTKRTTIDFCDMVWGPIVCGIAPPSRYQAVVVDELQDLSSPQFALLMRVIAPGGRFIGIGDPMQDIYQFRESLGVTAWRMIRNRDGGNSHKSLPLTMTFRCDRAIVGEANGLIPHLRARPDAGDGSVSTVTQTALVGHLLESANRPDNGLGPHTFVLSRSNAALMSCALQLWQVNAQRLSGHQISFAINGGKEMLEPLFAILDGLQTASTMNLFLGSLASWYRNEITKAEASNATSRAERVEEHYAMLTVAARYAAPNRIKRLLETLIGETSTGVLLSTVHKVKGLEADRVFLLRDTFARWAPDRDPEKPVKQEELNIEYVAITRARHELFWVTSQ